MAISGDTRFDRVYEILQQDNSLSYVSEFKNKQYTVVAGSTWGKDEKLLVSYINKDASKDEKFIIAPHNMNATRIEELRKSIVKKTVLCEGNSFFTCSITGLPCSNSPKEAA